MTKKSKAEQVEEKVQDAAPAAEQAEQMEGADAARQPSEEELTAMLRAAVWRRAWSIWRRRGCWA